jgi:hypothetical protein
MIDKDYFVRQAMTLLRMAYSVRDPGLAAKLVSKAADLEAKASESPGAHARRLALEEQPQP